MKMRLMLLACLSAGMMWLQGGIPASAAVPASAAIAPSSHTVNGTVSDATGPLIGATIRVAGTTNGTVTDFDGNFSIEVEKGEIIENLEEDNLCRTQIRVKMDSSVSRLLTNPCGNHHIIFYGKHKKEIEDYLKNI